MNDFAEPGSLDPTSLHLGGTKYMVIQGEPAVVILGKKVILSHPFLTHQLLQHFTLPKWLMLMGPKFSNGEGRIQPQVSAMFSHTLQES
uniref:Uncharacterized protein n=1 Tax=Nelumbo nucifera TaxID=4432 RepID=A0A822YNB3_NELNU|nr:TPA_asm: hypothetical protein HUJ06_004720 [Nelumbo nucifera]